MNAVHNDEVEFIRLPTVKKLTGFSTSTIYDMAKKGAFPRQVCIGGRSVAWIKAEVLQWSNERIQASRGDQSAASSESR